MKEGRYRLFKLNIAQDDYALVLRHDFVGMFTSLLPKAPSGLKKLDSVLDCFKEVSVASSDLRSQLNFSEKEIS